MEQPSDLDLIEEVRNGRREAYTVLMRRHQQRVYWFARRMVGSHADADDVTQETFVKAYMSLGSFRGDSTFSTWIYRITLNLSLNALRKRQLLKYVRESEILSRLLPSDEDPHRDVEAKEVETALRRAVERLPEKQRAVFLLRHYEEMPYEDIAGVLKTSVGGLKANYFHALRKVRDMMRHEIETGETETGGH